MNPLISLVIPVYNVEKYLDKCMESVLAQTYDNFEVILVDDGSTDNSGKMCDEYAKRDSRVTVYHKPNGGLSDARNFGVEHCNADLVSFIDSDDYVTEDYLEYLWYLMEKYDAELSCARHLLIKDDFEMSYSSEDYEEYTVDSEKAVELACYEKELTVSANTKLYKINFLRQNPYPKGRLYEDLATTYKIYSQCHKIAVSSKTIYLYCQHDGSIMHGIFSEKHFDIFLSAQEQHEFVKKYFPKIKNITGSRCASVVISLMSRFDLFDNNNSKKLFKVCQNFLKEYYIYAIIDVRRTLKFKINCTFVLLGYYPAKIWWNIKKQLKYIFKSGRK